MLRLVEIAKSFGTKAVLRPISMEIPVGKTAALLGPVGCKKKYLIVDRGWIDPPGPGTSVFQPRSGHTAELSDIELENGVCTSGWRAVAEPDRRSKLGVAYRARTLGGLASGCRSGRTGGPDAEVLVFRRIRGQWSERDLTSADEYAPSLLPGYELNFAAVFETA